MNELNSSLLHECSAIIYEKDYNEIMEYINELKLTNPNSCVQIAEVQKQLVEIEKKPPVLQKAGSLSKKAPSIDLEPNNVTVSVQSEAVTVITT